MTGVDSIASLDRRRLREVFDLRKEANAETVGGYEDDPYPRWHELRERAPVHPGTLHELTGHAGPVSFAGLPFEDRPHFTAFTFAACDQALRDQDRFTSSPVPVDREKMRIDPLNSLIGMGGSAHRRYRRLVQPSFALPRMSWWTDKWISLTVDQLIDWFAGDGHADLNVDFCAALPVLTITRSFGVEVGQAVAIREALHNPAELIPLLSPIIAARRQARQDDLISVLADAAVEDEAGDRHRLSDKEIYSFAMLLLLAGSGTTWRQTGTALTALLQRPELLEAVRRDRSLLPGVIDESLRWMPTNPMFSRFVTADTDLHGTRLPKGAVLHLAFGAANRDPRRWERPDEFDITRPPKPSLAFGAGPHVCLGMHVAKAEMRTGVGALLDRLPNLRLDPAAEPPRIIGMYHRGPTTIPVRFD